MKKKLYILSALFLMTAVAGASFAVYSCSKKTNDSASEKIIDDDTKEIEEEEIDPHKEEETKPQDDPQKEEEKKEEEGSKEEKSKEEEKKPTEDDPSKKEEEEKQEDPKEEDPKKEEECSHDWSDYVVTKMATCSNQGLKVRTCNSCKKTQSEVIPIDENNHDYGEAIITKRPTCLEEGEAVHYCNHNPDHILKEKLDKIDHIFSDKIEEVPATYREDGVKAHYHCLICDKDFGLDMTTVLSKKDLRIPKLDSSNIDKLESDISLLDTYSSDFKEYHGDVIDYVYEKYNSLNKNEKYFIDTEIYKDTTLTYKQKLDKLKETFVLKFPSIKKIYDAKTNCFGSIISSNSGSINKSNLVNEEYGYLNSLKISSGYKDKISFVVKPTNIATEYIRDSARIYIYSPIDVDINVSNNMDNKVVNTYHLSKNKFNQIVLDSSTLLKLFTNIGEGSLVFSIESITLDSEKEFKLSSIYSEYVTPEKILSEVETLATDYAFSKNIIQEKIDEINTCSAEFKKQPKTVAALNKLNTAMNYVSKKFELYKDLTDAQLYSYSQYLYNPLSVSKDSLLGNCVAFSGTATSTKCQLKTSFTHKAADLTVNKGIEFYIKGDFRNFSKLLIRNPNTYNTIEHQISYISSNLMRVTISSNVTYQYISEYMSSDVNTEITIYGTKVSEYKISSLYFFDTSI